MDEIEKQGWATGCIVCGGRVGVQQEKVSEWQGGAGWGGKEDMVRVWVWKRKWCVWQGVYATWW